MIDESRTLEIYGYISDGLKPLSHKYVVAVCEECGKYREIEFRKRFNLCKSCGHKRSNLSDETRVKMSNTHTGMRHSEETKRKMSRAHVGKHVSDETRKKLSEANLGKKHSAETRRKMSESTKGHSHSDETKRKISELHRRENLSAKTRKKLSDAGKGRNCSEATRKRISMANTGKKHSEESKKKMSIDRSGKNGHFYGKHHSDESRRRSSSTKQGIPYEEWESYAKESLYCPKFNEACRESNREKYDRRCFICGLLESENITSTGKQRKLSVHHVDMNKNQGCNDIRWRLVPVCLKHHDHSKLWTLRIIYLLNHVWN